MRKYSVGDEDDELIEFQSFVDMLSLFNFNSTREDCNELKFYLFNNDLISLRKEAHLKKDTFYLNCR